MTSDTKTTEETPAIEAEPVLSWDGLGLSPELLELIKKAGFEKPTPVQVKAIPLAMDNYDLLVSAQTGTGKTAAFTFPLIERIRGREGPYGLVLAPSREIALQTQVVMKQFGEPLGVRSVALIGGIDIRHDELALKNYPQVIVATPGRLCDHLERGNVWLDFIETVVLDEADRMLDMGFSDQLSRIMEQIPKNRQTLLFSATVPPNVEKLANRILYEPERVSIGKSVSAAKTVEQNFIFTDEEAKVRELHKILMNEPGTVFVFTRSKDRTSRLWRSLRSRGFYDATQIHSDLLQAHREQALEDFKAGKFRVLIATDVVGRGIHVDGVAHVVNYDVPREAEDYVHRIGRTGRADASGKATTLVTPADRNNLRKIERMIGRKVGAPEGSSGSRHSEERSRGTKPSGGHGRSSRGGGRSSRSGGGSGSPQAPRPTGAGKITPKS